MHVEPTRMYRVRDVAGLFGVSVATIYRAVESGALDAVKLGTGRGTLRVPGSAVLAYAEACAREIPRYAADHDEARREIGRLSTIAEDVIDLAEHGAGQPAEYFVTRLRELAERARRCESVTTTPACLWCGARPAPHTVLGDPLCHTCHQGLIRSSPSRCIRPMPAGHEGTDPGCPFCPPAGEVTR